jgi:hypothetical protein
MNGYTFKELTPGQRQTYQAAVELYQAYLAARKECRTFRGGMHWKKIRGRDYLYRYRDRYGHGESLGHRSEDTERLFAGFTRKRREIISRVRRERLGLQEHTRYCRAARVHRLPLTTAKIMRRLEEHPLGANLMVIGTAAIYAYEGAAGVFLDPGGSQNLLAASARRLTLAGAGETSWEELLRLLRRTDRSFAPLPDTACRAANRDGFVVQLVKSGLRRPGKQKTVTVPGALAPLPPEAGNLQYFLASPKFSQVVIGRGGYPVTLAAPDPRAFALHKFWLSQQEDRAEATRRRDYHQALAVADLVLRYLPQYEYFSTELDMLPQDLVRSASRFAEGADLAGEEDGYMEFD